MAPSTLEPHFVRGGRSQNRYEEDIKLLADAGGNAYRFSIEWARIEPKEGFYDENEIEHYRNVLRCCEKYGITPIVTLQHFSTPAWVISKGGWCREYVVSAFAKYAKKIAQELGGMIPYICTINEANMGYQLHKITQDMMKAGKREDGGVQVGTNTDLDMKKIILGMFEQGWAFKCNPFGVNTFLKPRSEKQEKIVMRAHQAAKKEIRSAAPNTKVGLTLCIFEYQSVDGGEEQAEKLW